MPLQIKLSYQYWKSNLKTLFSSASYVVVQMAMLFCRSGGRSTFGSWLKYLTHWTDARGLTSMTASCILQHHHEVERCSLNNCWIVTFPDNHVLEKPLSSCLSYLLSSHLCPKNSVCPRQQSKAAPTVEWRWLCEAIQSKTFQLTVSFFNAFYLNTTLLWLLVLKTISCMFSVQVCMFSPCTLGFSPGTLGCLPQSRG